MLVMKFGGASVKNPDAVRNVCRIIQSYIPQDKLLIVVSAMDKTTNHLEKLAGLAKEGKEDKTWERFRSIRDFHHQQIDGLFGKDDKEVRENIGKYFAQIERIIRGILLLGEFPDRTYDRIVAFGELLSTAIVSQYLRKEGLAAVCPDAREVIKTDATHTQAAVIWSLTRENVNEKILPLLEANEVVVTQGFIGSSLENKVTTLGREGSDYTGSIFASCLGADSFTVWKDVRGILNGDPRIETDTVKLDVLSYERAVEMTFYGASVIHPKTIKPLRNAGIPLFVKCFKDTSETGTVIQHTEEKVLPKGVCSRIRKKNQILITLTPKDFSFMEGNLLGRVFSRVARAGIMVNLIQSSAISLTLCVNNVSSSVQEFESLLIDDFKIERREGVELRTYIDYGKEELERAESALVSQFADGKLLVVESIG